MSTLTDCLIFKEGIRVKEGERMPAPSRKTAEKIEIGIGLVHTKPWHGEVANHLEEVRVLTFERMQWSERTRGRIKRNLKRNWKLYLAVILLVFLLPATGFCDVETTMKNIQGKLVNTILPLAAILGFVFAGLSFVAGSPNARSHLILAITGAVVGFGAQSIMEFIKSVVR